ncbi:GNAT family N-acetyltransferase [Paenibacillus sp. FSL H7-0331]|uniref:GNAT family N-acetyltransferase n=1 Tax=Paenibacillus sp. FSL H7-0331 TaxID=1920421 RepID=UPI002116948E|nr:GNAT family protein [Paenibacillus sp. FSL H7-0331]
METERFVLRQMTLEDAPTVFEIFSDGDVTKDMGEDPFTSIQQAEGLITFMNNLFHQNKAFRWGIILKENNTLVGTCGYNGWETHRGSRGEIGYDLGKKYWRQGYMTEVLKSVIAFGFETMEFNRIEAFTNLDAEPSMLLLKKLGFNEDGILRGYASFHGEYVDQRCYSLLQREWLS